MPAASDLVLYAAANMPDTDAGAAGGAIDLKRRVDFTQLAADDDIEVVSDNAGDTQNCTIDARKPNGQIVSETKALTGTTPAVFSTLGVVERVLKVELASDAVGAITVQRSGDGTDLRIIPAGERGFLALFRKGASDPDSPVDYYAKVFFKNTHATEALLNAVVREDADPTGKLTFTLAAAKDDTATSTNRLTAPDTADTNPDTFDGTEKAVPGTDLAEGEAIGVWVKLSLTAGDSPYRSTYTLELAGESV